MMRKMGVLLLLTILLTTASAALAGGWAVVTLDSPPGEIRAGAPWTLGFTVLQHGRTPVHTLGTDIPIRPLLVATHSDNGRRVEVEAMPTDETGHFIVTATFPAGGQWEWTIYPNPLAGESLFEPLNVLPALPAADTAAGPAAHTAPVFVPAATDSGLALPVLLRWLAVGAALAAVVVLVVQRRQLARAES